MAEAHRKDIFQVMIEQFGLWGTGNFYFIEHFHDEIIFFLKMVIFCSIFYLKSMDLLFLNQNFICLCLR